MGVEEELLIFDDRYRPAPLGEVLAQDMGGRAQHELKLEQVEIGSDPAVEIPALEADLRARRAGLVAAARSRGAVVAALSSSPVPVAPTPTPDERYARMQDRFGLVTAEQLVCGAHVHVAVGSRAQGVAVIDGVRPWLAVLAALSVNSPFWQGLDTGYASYRTISWGRWPATGPTARFGDEAAYDRALADLIESGAAMDTGMIYFDVRLSAKYPTVEFRVFDVGQEVSDSSLQAALCRAAVETVLSREPAATPACTSPVRLLQLRAAAWRAARYGLGGELLDVCDERLRPAADLVDRMVDELTPALRRTGDEGLVRAGLDHLLRRGTGAELQRADLAASGGLLAAVVERAAQRTAG